MGLFSGLASGIAKLKDKSNFMGERTAREAQERAGELGQQALGMQQSMFDYIREQQEPFAQSALRALPVQEAMIGLGGPEAQAAEIQNVQQSPFYQSMIGTGEEAVLRNAAATGGIRGGAVQPALAQNSQNVLQNLYNQKLQGLGQLSTRGGQASAQGQQGGLQALGQISGTLGNIAQGGVSSAAAQQQAKGGMLGGLFSMFSDERLKTNINKIGEKNGLPFYKWEWNETAKNKFNLSGKETGHMVSDVELKYPDAVGEKDGYKTVNYGALK